MTVTSGQDADATKPRHGATLGWALRRAALGLLILTIAVGTFAWLLYATIDPDPAEAGQNATQNATMTQATPASRAR